MHKRQQEPASGETFSSCSICVNLAFGLRAIFGDCRTPASTTGPSAMDPALSMSLFKSPDYAQEVRGAVNVWQFTSANLCLGMGWNCLQVWQWLDKHGDTPLQRERFKHLVIICTIKPAKVPAVQPLQRTSGNQGSASFGQKQQRSTQQGSTRFLPEASIVHKPAALARPASAAAARRRHEIGPRPSTAAAAINGAYC